MKKYIEQCLPKITMEIEKALSRKVGDGLMNGLEGGGRLELFNKIIRVPYLDMMERGGKRLRPVMSCLMYQSLDGKKSEIYKLSIVSELIHNGTLIIDDIEDNSTLRRGKACIHKIYGHELAINFGNFLYYYPLKMIGQASISTEQKKEMYELVARELTKLHIGQGLDIYWSKNKIRKISLSDYLYMCACKTGALLSVALNTGVILAEGNKKMIDEVSEIAVLMGLVYQVRDDVLNIKPMQKWGKKTGEDIAEGKLTFLIASFFEKANARDQKRMNVMLSTGSKAKKIVEEVVKLLDKYEIFDLAEELIKEKTRILKMKLNKVLPDSKYKRIFTEIVDYLGQREY